MNTESLAVERFFYSLMAEFAGSDNGHDVIITQYDEEYFRAYMQHYISKSTIGHVSQLITLQKQCLEGLRTIEPVEGSKEGLKKAIVACELARRSIRDLKVIQGKT